MLINEESSSAGAGTLLTLETPAAQGRKSSAQDFFSQLNWTEQTTGSAEYAPFQDQFGSGSDSSSDSDDDFNNIRHDPFFSAPNSKEGNAPPGSGVPFVNFDDFESESGGGGRNDQSRQGQGKSRKIPTPQSARQQEEAKLIEFTIAEDEDETVEAATIANSQATPTKKAKEQDQRNKETFGVSFDPWGTPSTTHQRQFQGKTALEVSDLLGLEDSDEHSTLSDVQSEVRAAGAETFSNHLDRRGMMGNTAGEKKTSSSNQFDPFGSLPQQTNDTSSTSAPLQPRQVPITAASSSLSNDPLFNLLMDTPSTTITTTAATATTNATSASTGSSPDPFGNLLGPAATTLGSLQPNGAPGASSGTGRHHMHAHHSSTPPTLVTNLSASAGAGGMSSQRRVSQPPHINDHLSPLHSFSQQSGGRAGGSGLGYMSSHSQPNLSAFSSSAGTSGSAFSPFGQQQQQRQSQQAGFGGGRTGHPSYMGGGSASTSPRSTSPTPFSAHHSSSTGNLLQGGGGQATMAGRVNPPTTSMTTSSMDPFAQFNLGFMTGAKPTTATSQSPSQPTFKPQPSQSTPYQPYYMRQPAAGSETNSGSAGGGAQQTQGKSPKGKSLSGSNIGSGSASVFAPRKPNYNPTMAPESKTGKHMSI